MMLNSRYTQLGAVALPHTGRQRYMHSFDVAAPCMAEGYEDYLEPVTALLTMAGATHGEAHMTVDERVVKAGATQRRPHPHVDGCYVPTLRSWMHPSPGAWAHGVKRMPIIVASSVSACRVWRGDIDAEPTSTGDLTHAVDLLDDGELAPANVGYLLSPDCVHESEPMIADCPRTFLRIALPVDFVGDWV